MTELPVIDVSGLTSAEFSARAAVAAKLGKACRETGFFYVVSHGIPGAARDAIFAAARAFFSLPLAAKEACSIKRSRHNRGYVALEGERLNESAVLSDYKEAFNVGLELAADHPEVLAGRPFRGVNLWPAISGWRETVLAYYDACWALGRRIHRGFALDLGVAEDFFENKLDAPLAILRMLHYPPQPQRRDQAPESGAGMHTDYGNLTILATDGVAGLQVRAKRRLAGRTAHSGRFRLQYRRLLDALDERRLPLNAPPGCDPCPRPIFGGVFSRSQSGCPRRGVAELHGAWHPA